MTTWKRVVRAVLPEAVTRLLVRRFWRVRWTGDYRSWADARAATGGYDAPEILRRAQIAARAVRDGQAAYERDGAIFKEPAVNAPLVRCLQRAATERNGVLRVVDVGGALGSSYWQHRSWLRTLREVRWAVVELPAVVRVGRAEFANAELSFFETIPDACTATTADVAVFASVLPYVDEPEEMLRQVTTKKVRHLFIDRTGMIEGDCDRITIQRVPRSLHRASYPCRFFSRKRLLERLADYEVVEEFVTPDGHESGFTFRGFWLTRSGDE